MYLVIVTAVAEGAAVAFLAWLAIQNGDFVSVGIGWGLGCICGGFITSYRGKK